MNHPPSRYVPGEKLLQGFFDSSVMINPNLTFWGSQGLPGLPEARVAALSLLNPMFWRHCTPLLMIINAFMQFIHMIMSQTTLAQMGSVLLKQPRTLCFSDFRWTHIMFPSRVVIRQPFQSKCLVCIIQVADNTDVEKLGKRCLMVSRVFLCCFSH